MRRQHFPSWTVILCFAVGLVFTAIADDDQGGGEFDREIVLMATTNAPVGATGRAELEADNEDGITSAHLQVETEGLLAGTYTVSVTDTTGTNTFTLGTFDVGSSTNENDDSSEEDQNGGEAHFPLPVGLSPATVASVSITDSNMVLDLTGTFPSLTASLDEEIVLTAITNAPAGATGKAELEAENDDGMISGNLRVETQGLLAGTYTVNVTDKSGTNTFVLGTFDVGTSTNENDDTQGDDDNQGEENDGGDAHFALPAGLNAMDVATISIADSNGVPVLVGDFTNATNIEKGEFDAEATVSAGPESPGVTGSAVMSVHTKKGKQHSKFLLVARGAPPGQRLTILVNGVARGKAHSDRRGNVRIKHLAKVNLATMKSVVAVDAQSKIVLSVSF
jgi:hypothetical protein